MKIAQPADLERTSYLFPFANSTVALDDEMFNRMSQPSHRPNVMLQNEDANFSNWPDSGLEVLEKALL